MTAELLLDASRDLVEGKPTLLADGGVENYNQFVYGLHKTLEDFKFQAQPSINGC